MTAAVAAYLLLVLIGLALCRAASRRPPQMPHTSAASPHSRPDTGGDVPIPRAGVAATPRQGPPHI